jgi:hypothetical protein
MRLLTRRVDILTKYDALVNSAENERYPLDLPISSELVKLVSEP